MAVADQHLPLTIGMLQAIQIEGDKIVEKSSLYLATKHVYL